MRELILDKVINKLYERHSNSEIDIDNVMKIMSFYRIDRKICRKILIVLEEENMIERISRDKIKVIIKPKEQ